MLSIFKKKSPINLEKQFSDWIMTISKSSKLDKDIVAINFGLFQTPESYSVYLIGSKSYDRNDDDWACNEDFVPKDKYFNLPKMETKGKDWEKIQEMVIQFVKSFIQGDSYEDSILHSIENVTCGFDDGEVIKIK